MSDPLPQRCDEERGGDEADEEDRRETGPTQEHPRDVVDTREHRGRRERLQDISEQQRAEVPSSRDDPQLLNQAGGGGWDVTQWHTPSAPPRAESTHRDEEPDKDADPAIAPVGSERIANHRGQAA